VDALFDSGSHGNLVVVDLVRKIGLEVHDHPIQYPLGWVNKDVGIKFMKQSKIKFSISANFIDEMELDVVPLDVHGAMFGRPYMYIRDVIFMWRIKQYFLIKMKSLTSSMHTKVNRRSL
jgi:hypothetical protein